jgi:hypothetical protein
MVPRVVCLANIGHVPRQEMQESAAAAIGRRLPSWCAKFVSSQVSTTPTVPKPTSGLGVPSIRFRMRERISVTPPAAHTTWKLVGYLGSLRSSWLLEAAKAVPPRRIIKRTTTHANPLDPVITPCRRHPSLGRWATERSETPPGPKGVCLHLPLNGRREVSLSLRTDLRGMSVSGTTRIPNQVCR